MNLITGNEQLTMTSLEIANLIETRHDNVKISIERLANRGTIVCPALQDGIKSANGVVVQVYLLDKRSSYIVVAQLSPEFTARVIDRWQELENKAALPNFNDPAQAARAWANQYEMTQLVESQRDKAIQEKAWISEKQTATAMNTASIYSKQNVKLNDELGRGKNWKSVKAIPWVKDYFYDTKPMWQMLGKKLTSISKEMGIEKRLLDDSMYGRVGGYHITVIGRLRHRLDGDPNMLGQFRIPEGEW